MVLDVNANTSRSIYSATPLSLDLSSTSKKKKTKQKLIFNAKTVSYVGINSQIRLTGFLSPTLSALAFCSHSGKTDRLSPVNDFSNLATSFS